LLVNLEVEVRSLSLKEGRFKQPSSWGKQLQTTVAWAIGVVMVRIWHLGIALRFDAVHSKSVGGDEYASLCCI